MKTWAIIGLGWLGESLAQRLKENNIHYWGTHKLSFDFTKDDLPATSHDILFLNTPPLKNLAASDYLKKISNSKAQRIIFISSTSVFGESHTDVDESTPPIPDTDSGKWLWEMEQALRKHYGEKLLVVRPGGLIGGERHPARHLSGRKELAGGRDCINLVHRTDLISLILAAPKEQTLLHAVSSHHPTRAEYYALWCERLNLAAPEFIDESVSKRRVNSCLGEQLIQWQCQQLDWL